MWWRNPVPLWSLFCTIVFIHLCKLFYFHLGQFNILCTTCFNKWLTKPKSSTLKETPGCMYLLMRIFLWWPKIWIKLVWFCFYIFACNFLIAKTLYRLHRIVAGRKLIWAVPIIFHTSSVEASYSTQSRNLK